VFRPRCSYSRGRRRRRRLRGRCKHVECGRPRRAHDGLLLGGQSRGCCAPVFRSEVEHPSFRPVGREAQHAFEISLGAQVMKFARRNERSKYRVPAEAFWSLEALPVVQPQDETAQLALAHVIVNAKSTVFEKATELFALIVGIGDRRAQRNARIDMGAVEPCRTILWSADGEGAQARISHPHSSASGGDPRVRRRAQREWETVYVDQDCGRNPREDATIMDDADFCDQSSSQGTRMALGNTARLAELPLRGVALLSAVGPIVQARCGGWKTRITTIVVSEPVLVGLRWRRIPPRV